jgi:hypothetical protein
MDHLVIAQTEQTPLVSFLSNGLMEISGKSIDEDSQEFCKLIKYFQEILLNLHFEMRSKLQNTKVSFF